MPTGSGPRHRAAQLRAEAAAHAAEVERLSSEAEMWDRGADGEDEVQALLEAGLPASLGWHVVATVVTSPSGADIDHVVVGPAGVFTLNTKHHPDKNIWVSPVQFLVDGHRQDYLHKSRGEATRAEERLGAACGYPVHVQSVIVVVGAASLNVVEQPDQPRVEAADSVVGWLRSLPALQSAERARSIADAVRDPETWFGMKQAAPKRSPERRPTPRSTQRPRARRRRTAVRRSSLATPVVAVVLIVIAFAILRHHPTNSDGLSGSTTTSAPPAPSATFEAVGTVINGQCVDAWSNHDVEVEVAGAEAGTDCTSIASPARVAIETASAGAFGALTGPYGRATVGDGLDPVCSNTLSSGDQVTVYDEGSAAFGHAFCTSFNSSS